MAKVVYVDDNDKVIGSGTKRKADQEGIKTRVARIFVFNKKGELYIQKRAHRLIFGPGLWDQSVGGYVDEGEDYLDAALREGKEEIGLPPIELKKIGHFYTEEHHRKYIRRRFNTLYEAVYDGQLEPNKDEVEEGKWISLGELEAQMAERPHDFLEGFYKAYKFYKKSKVKI